MLAQGTVCEVTTQKAGMKKVPFVCEGAREDGYIILRNQQDSNAFISLHPEHAARIAANGFEAGIKVLNTTGLQDVVVKATPNVVEVQPVVTAAPQSSKAAGASKKERAREIRIANPNATRKELITMFMAQLGMTAAGASTYASYKD